MSVRNVAVAEAAVAQNAHFGELWEWNFFYANAAEVHSRDVHVSADVEMIIITKLSTKRERHEPFDFVFRLCFNLRNGKMEMLDSEGSQNEHRFWAYMPHGYKSQTFGRKIVLCLQLDLTFLFLFGPQLIHTGVIGNFTTNSQHELFAGTSLSCLIPS